MKKLISLFLTLCILAGLIATLPLSVNAAATEITIASVDDWMSKLSGKTIGEANITVTATELDFEGKKVAPIKGFKGTFEGNGVVIKNLNMGNDVAVNGENGIFSCLAGAATFKNFLITDSKIEGTQWVGAIACCTGGNVEVKNVYISDSVLIKVGKTKDNSYAGGLFGGLAGETKEALIDSCVFAGTVEAEGKYCGGFIGDAYKCPSTTITNSLSMGKVAAESKNAGSCGFIGDCAGYVEQTVTLTNCIYAGGAENEAYYNRVFFRNAEYATVTNCYTTVINKTEKVYNEVLYNEKNSGVTLIEKADLIGAEATVTLDGWTKRAGDIMVPTGVAAFAPAVYGKTYTVTWMNGDTVLATEEYQGGAMPEYKGETPTLAEDDVYTYTFSGWSPELSEVFADVTYDAEFFKTRKNITVDDGEDEDDVTTAPVTNSTPTTNAPTTEAPTNEEQGGCGAIAGGSALALVLILGGAVVLGKKEN